MAASEAETTGRKHVIADFFVLPSFLPGHQEEDKQKHMIGARINFVKQEPAFVSFTAKPFL